MDAPEREEKPCRSCRGRPEVPFKHGRCSCCHDAFQLWLAGGVHHAPEWNGLISQPVDAEEPRSATDRALHVRAMMDVE